MDVEDDPTRRPDRIVFGALDRLSAAQYTALLLFATRTNLDVKTVFDRPVPNLEFDEPQPPLIELFSEKNGESLGYEVTVDDFDWSARKNGYDSSKAKMLHRTMIRNISREEVLDRRTDSIRHYLLFDDMAALFQEDGKGNKPLDAIQNVGKVLSGLLEIVVRDKQVQINEAEKS